MNTRIKKNEMKIEIKTDFRQLKNGDIYDFTIIEDLKSLCVVGDNGCGKSSLFHALRGTKNDLPSESLYKRDCQDLARMVDIYHNYDKIFYLDSILDDGRNFNNAYDASNLVISGGFTAGKLSHGQSSLMYLSNFLSKINDLININDKVLIVFDEIDKGFNLTNQSKYHLIIENIIRKYNAHIIFITHNILTISQSLIIYDFSAKTMVSATDYLENKIGYRIEKINI